MIFKDNNLPRDITYPVNPQNTHTHTHTQHMEIFNLMSEKVETVTDFIFLGSKITADGDCSHEIKRRLLLRSKVMTNLDSTLKSRDITLSTNICRVKSVFSSSHVRMWEMDYKEGWALKNWCFPTVVLEKTLESPLDCKEIQQSILKEISPEYQYWSSSTLATCCKEPTHWKRPWFWERLKAGERDNRGWDG